MPVSVSSQIATLTALVQQIGARAEEDRQERKAEREAITKALAQDRALAETSRQATSAELADIRHGQADALRRLNKIEPVTDLVTSVRSKIAGGLMVAGVIGGIAWAGVVFFKEIVVGWFQ